ncbi:hypothetical protein BerOc1_03683 [Pseudodesulfovibrio hydrargyri]|uniref:Uncharacterized protein n=1 Tax=Pseudodesulfovibrio hydrargyri TaxID=2125990 RepID=A0A1J5N2A2_9BACT|nr:hypothetical protein [Pseudodesulfovibrio hydrargyri]OIQ48928.1 hypothetical protein BerOc1_03683 [Pseudodesulfovibrio hydrargyri]
MSDISISMDTIQSMSMDNQLLGPESLNNYADEIGSGINPTGGMDNREQTVAGLEVASRTDDYLGAGTDFSSTGTDVDIQQTMHQMAAETGIGSITDKIA